MEDMEEFNQHRELLLTLVNSINAEIPLKESNQVLIVYKLNTIDKIRKFNEWVESRFQGDKLLATE